MARPLTASDEQIFNAARAVLARRGPDAFSIAEVASEVGLSRAAIILRFTSTRALKLTVLAKLVDQFAAALEVLPKSPSGDSLLHLAAFLGAYVGRREGSARYFTNYTSNLHDAELLDLERRRGAALSAAISKAMPKVAIDHESAVIAFRTHLTGCIITWLSLVDDSNPRRYLVLRTKEWLALAGIAFNRRLAEELTAPVVAEEKKAASAAGRPKAKSTGQR